MNLISGLSLHFPTTLHRAILEADKRRTQALSPSALEYDSGQCRRIKNPDLSSYGR
jgi:hypothetical protein